MDEEQIKELYCKEISKIEGDPERIKDTEHFCYDKKRKKVFLFFYRFDNFFIYIIIRNFI